MIVDGPVISEIANSISAGMNAYGGDHIVFVPQQPHYCTQ